MTEKTERIVITGGSGLVGRALTKILVADGFDVVILSRSPQKVQNLPQNARAIRWDTETADGWLDEADGAAAIVNLAGPNLAGQGFFPQRWTEERRHYLRQSRIDAGKAVVDAVERAENKPGVVIQASAIGYYGARDDEILDEDAAPGDDYLARLCVDWENSTRPVEAHGVRRAVVRSGLVLSTEEGSLPRVILPYKLFVGGPFGSGDQWWSWIHLHDEARAIRFLLENDEAQGAYNLTSPNPKTNDDFGRTLARVMGRPHLIPVPGFAMRAAFGEVSMVVLEGQRVLPRRLQELGFTFEYPQLEAALRHLFRQDI